MAVDPTRDYYEDYRECREFIKNSSESNSKDVQRAKEHLMFYSGDQFSSVKEDLHRGKRINKSFSELPKYVQAIKSAASKSPYHSELARSSTLEEAGSLQSLEQYQKIFDIIEADNDYKSQMMQGTDSAIVTGVGVVLLTTVMDEITGEAKYVIESLRDISKVAFDRDCVKDDKSDAEGCAIINYVSKRKAKRDFGERTILPTGITEAFPSQWVIPDDSVPLITYYRKGFDENKGKVEYFQFCGKECIAYELLNLPMIPVFKMTGYIVYRDNKFVSVGIIDRVQDLQVGANLAYSALFERLNRSVKAGYICPAEAIEGLHDQIGKLADGDTPLFLYKNGFEKPTQIIEAFNTDDLMSVLSTSANLMSSVIGVPSQGVVGIKNMNTTATEVLVQEANSESNVSCFYESYERVCRNISICLLNLLTNGAPGDIIVKLVNGPSVITRNSKRRQEISMMASMMDEKTKPLLAKYYAESLDDDLGKKISADIVANLDPSVKLTEETQDPAAIHQLKQMRALNDNTMQELEKTKQENEALSKENEVLNLSLLDNREARMLDMQKAIMANETETNTKLAELALKDKEIANDLFIKQQNIRLDAQKQLNDSIAQNNEAIYGTLTSAEAPKEMVTQ